MSTRWQGILHEFAEWLPIGENTPRLTLYEGATPLLRAERLEKRLPGTELYIKYEGLNPTGSFKDRGMVMAVAKAVEQGARKVICASTGNTAASAAAYAARAGIGCLVVIPDGNIALGKLAQALFYGAEVIAIEGNFDQALTIVRELVEVRSDIALVNSVNPYRLEGQKTSSFEICQVLGGAPDILALPVGNAGNISAYWKGFVEWHEAGVIQEKPKMWGFQAAGAAPLVHGAPVVNPETVATAIRIGNPASWNLAVAARDESGGLIDAVTDEQILEAQRLLAAEEGIFVEPASAASLAGVLEAQRRGMLQPGQRIVCVVTGNGLKDPDTALKACGQPRRVAATRSAVEACLVE